MPIDFSLINTNFAKDAVKQSLDSYYKDKELQQSQQQLNQQQSNANDQTLLKAQSQQDTRQFNQGQLANTAQANQNTAIANQNTNTFQQGQLANTAQANQNTAIANQDLNQYRQADLGLRKQENSDLKDYRYAELGQKAQDSADLKDFRNKTIGMDYLRFNMDNSKNLFDQSIALQKQAIENKQAANTQLTFDQNQQYLKDMSGAKSMEDQQKIALAHGQVNDAVSLGQESRTQMQLANQEGMRDFQMGLHAHLLETAKMNNPAYAAQSNEDYLTRSQKYAADHGYKGVLRTLSYAQQISDPVQRQQFLIGIAGYGARNMGAALNNPTGNAADTTAAEQASSPNNPFNYQNVMQYPGTTGQMFNDPNLINSPPKTLQQGAQQALTAGPDMTQKEDDKARELKQGRENAALQRAQAQADQDQEILQLHNEQYALTKEASAKAKEYGVPAPGVAYEGYLSGVGDKIGVHIGSYGESQNDLAKAQGNQDIGGLITAINQKGQQIGKAQAGKVDPLDPAGGRLAKEFMQGAPSAKSDVQDQAVLNLTFKQRAQSSQLYNENLQKWVQSGRSSTTFSSAWAPIQKQIDTQHEKELKDLNDQLSQTHASEKKQEVLSQQNATDTASVVTPAGGHGVLAGYLGTTLK